MAAAMLELGPRMSRFREACVAAGASVRSFFEFGRGDWIAVDPAVGPDQSGIAVLRLERNGTITLLGAERMRDATTEVGERLARAANDTMQEVADRIAQDTLRHARAFPVVPVERDSGSYYRLERGRVLHEAVASGAISEAAARGLIHPAEYDEAIRGAGARASTTTRRARAAAEEARRLETRPLPEGARAADGVAARIQDVLNDNEAAFLERYVDVAPSADSPRPRARQGELVDVRAEELAPGALPPGGVSSSAPGDERRAATAADLSGRIEPRLTRGPMAGHFVVGRWEDVAMRATIVEYLTPDRTSLVRRRFNDEELVTMGPRLALELGLLSWIHQPIPVPRHVNCRSTIPIGDRGTLSSDDNDDDDAPYRPAPLAGPVTWSRR